MVVGITGKYCSGKSMVGRMFTDKGWHELDIDRYGHEALQEKAPEVIDLFGPSIVDKDGFIDRRKLGSIVFGSRSELEKLESVIHPVMINRCKNYIKDNKNQNIIINAAILHHMGLNKLCDSVVWVKASLFVRYKRAKKRDGLSSLHILRRIFNQHKLDAKYWKEDVDIHTIWNDDAHSKLVAEVNLLIEEYKKRV